MVSVYCQYSTDSEAGFQKSPKWSKKCKGGTLFKIPQNANRLAELQKTEKIENHCRILA